MQQKNGNGEKTNGKIELLSKLCIKYFKQVFNGIINKDKKAFSMMIAVSLLDSTTWVKSP